MAKILIVEDEDSLREALSMALSEESHTVISAVNGKTAKDILGTQEFDLVISDIQMPFCGGLELLDWMRSRSRAKFVLMTGFGHLLETRDAHSLGVDEFLLKPFLNADLRQCLKKVLLNERREEFEAETLEASPRYCKVSIDEFVSRPLIEFDLYIRLSETKYVKIGHAGSLLPREQIENYKKQGEQFLYIPSDCFTKLLENNLEIARMLKGSRAISKEKKLSFLKHTGEVLLEKVFVDGMDKETVRDSTEYLKLTVQTISENADFVDLVELMNSHSDQIYAQCVATSLYSVMIARTLGVTSSQTFFKLGMAGLYHEVGLKEIDREILQKPRPLLSTQERKLIESHPVRGQEILIAMGNMPSDVIQLVLEHHEDQTATGYPRSLKKINQHPLSSVMQLSSIFAETLLRKKNDDKFSASAAIIHIEEVYRDRVDLRCLAALKSIFSRKD